jgi:hypothetical protein
LELLGLCPECKKAKEEQGTTEGVADINELSDEET